jgi:CBS domain-containing protein
MQIKDVMTHNAECAQSDASLQEAAEKMRSLDVGSLPICENDKLVGMITDRDITVRGTSEARDPRRTHVCDIMTPGVTWCFEDEDVSHAVRLMEEKQIRRLVVLSRDKKLSGILSLGDVAIRSGDDHLSAEALHEVSEPGHLRPEARRPH